MTIAAAKPTCRQRVLQALMRGDWVPLYELQRPEIGGTDASRRVRELREEGYDILWEFRRDHKGEKTHTSMYKLVRVDEKDSFGV